MSATDQNGHGGYRGGAGRWSKVELEAFARGDSDAAIAAIGDRPLETVRRKRASLAGRPLLRVRRRVAEPRGRAAKPETVPAEPKTDNFRAAQRVVEAYRQLAASSRARGKAAPQGLNPFKLPDFPPMAVPKEKSLQMAMDDSMQWCASQWDGGFGGTGGWFSEGLAFPGFTYLSELSQRTEYRNISETIADDATRKWIDFDVVGSEAEDARKDEAEEEKRLAQMGRPMSPDEKRARREDRVRKAGKSDRVKQLKDDQARLELRDRIYRSCRDDGFFGRSHTMIDLGANDEELKSPIGDGRDKASLEKVTKGSLRAIKVIEPVWTYPTTYNAIDPARDDFYRPEVWYVLGKQYHWTRLLPWIGHPVPDILKPNYAFGGVSLSQLAKPYVDIWLTTRESVALLVKAFSVMVLKTDINTILSPGGGGAEGLMARVDAFNATRDNQGTFVVNKNTEDFSNVSASLSGLHELQAQALEHICSAVRIPLVKFTGISPSGLNASSEGEILSYDDSIAAYQNRFVRPNLTRIVNFEQLSLWGEVDPTIMFDFEKLREMTEKEVAELQKMDGERHSVYVDMGAVSPAEVRGIIIDDPKLPYGDLDREDLPDLKLEEESGMIPEGSGRGIEAVLEEGQQSAGEGYGESGENGAKPHRRTAVDAGEPAGLSWAGQYEWMRGYHLPSLAGDGAPIQRAPRGDAAAAGLRVGSRVRYAAADGAGGVGRVFGFVHDAFGGKVAILDSDRDVALTVPSASVSARPVVAKDADFR